MDEVRMVGTYSVKGRGNEDEEEEKRNTEDFFIDRRQQNAIERVLNLIPIRIQSLV
jgi:hypothetical protein